MDLARARLREVARDFDLLLGLSALAFVLFLALAFLDFALRLVAMRELLVQIR